MFLHLNNKIAEKIFCFIFILIIFLIVCFCTCTKYFIISSMNCVPAMCQVSTCTIWCNSVGLVCNCFSFSFCVFCFLSITIEGAIHRKIECTCNITLLTDTISVGHVGWYTRVFFFLFLVPNTK